MDHTDVGLRAVVRALADVVTPAVDESNSLAREQLRLSIDYIEFVAARLEYLNDREVFDLRNHLAMARNIVQILGDAAAPGHSTLVAAIGQGETALSSGAVPMRSLKDATASLAAAVADVVRSASEMEQSVARAIEKAVIDSSKERIAFERAWYEPLGFDPNPGNVPSVRDVMDRQLEG
ncbi:MAG: hypothetical protein H6883_05710 [Rhodobiaceae bacterium]|nr:hypothetical protein [Rhodobiaceae bacterium]MCC0055613.1 hypothetical protein [Rhodobiaceae bacterium]